MEAPYREDKGSSLAAPIGVYRRPSAVTRLCASAPPR
jgi:hypothetical protein